MNLDNIHSVYFIGIGGIGMSALARFFKERNCTVSGYDKTETALTKQLVAEGMHIHYTEDLTKINTKADVIVYTPAIPNNHIELQWLRENKYTIVKRSDVLQAISEYMQAICVAGTHGKTTISTLIAHLLRASDVGCNAFLGGISSNYNSNYWSSANKLAVIEADEYDRSFLKLNPSIAVVSAMDADHLDIYGTVEEMERCYLQFIKQVKNTLVYKHGLTHSALFEAPSKISYSLQNDAATYYASDIQMRNGSYQFNFCKQGEVLGEFILTMGGMHNVENAVAALAVCEEMGVDRNLLPHALAAFKGVKRRFEYILKQEDVVYIDDYAHHPEELRMLIQSAKTLFVGKKVSVVFQPHLFTRTRDLADGFAESLDIADEVIVLDIYPARELPIEGINSQMILDKMSLNNRHLLSKEGVLQWVEASPLEVIITAGAGDIDGLVDPIKNRLLKKQA